MESKVSHLYEINILRVCKEKRELRSLHRALNLMIKTCATVLKEKKPLAPKLTTPTLLIKLVEV